MKPGLRNQGNGTSKVRNQSQREGSSRTGAKAKVCKFQIALRHLSITIRLNSSAWQDGAAHTLALTCQAQTRKSTRNSFTISLTCVASTSLQGNLLESSCHHFGCGVCCQNANSKAPCQRATWYPAAVSRGMCEKRAWHAHVSTSGTPLLHFSKLNVATCCTNTA